MTEAMEMVKTEIFLNNLGLAFWEKNILVFFKKLLFKKKLVVHKSPYFCDKFLFKNGAL
ncbi:hypothetical protein CM15mP35_05850 [bacterium]|nr:MAG: hypothetical protein CM15mP35_05850 [bacterium]